MIFLNCNIRRGHSTKSRRASYNLKKTLRRYEFADFWRKIPRTPYFYFDLIKAYELKGGFSQKRLFCRDCLSLNHSHFWMVWATDPRLVSNERYFDAVLGEKQWHRYSKRVIPPNMKDFVDSGEIVCRIEFQWTKCI